MEGTQGVTATIVCSRAVCGQPPAMPRASARLMLVLMHEPALRASSAWHASQKHRALFAPDRV